MPSARKHLWVGAVASAVLVVGLLVGVASATDHGDVIYACEKNGKIVSGSMMVNEVPKCSGNKNLVSWSQEGPVGPAGPAGPVGPAGPAGDPETRFITFSATENRLEDFAIKVGCSENFRVHAVYVSAEDPDGDLEFSFTGVSVVEPVGDATFFRVNHTDYSGGNLQDELLSQMNVAPVSVPADDDATTNRFWIFGGSTSGDRTDDVMDVGVMVDVVPGAACNGVVGSD